MPRPQSAFHLSFVFTASNCQVIMHDIGLRAELYVTSLRIVLIQYHLENLAFADCYRFFVGAPKRCPTKVYIRNGEAMVKHAGARDFWSFHRPRNVWHQNDRCRVFFIPYSIKHEIYIQSAFPFRFDQSHTLYHWNLTE